MASHAAEKNSFSRKIVIAAIIAIVCYTGASFALDYHDDMLTASWFAFWTVELISLCTIKKDKIKNKYESEE